jgi:hypothetical protein
VTTRIRKLVSAVVLSTCERNGITTDHRQDSRKSWPHQWLIVVLKH